MCNVLPPTVYNLWAYIFRWLPLCIYNPFYVIIIIFTPTQRDKAMHENRSHDASVNQSISGFQYIALTGNYCLLVEHFVHIRFCARGHEINLICYTSLQSIYPKKRNI